MKKIKLKNCGDYVVSPKISTNELSQDNYITTDNMLPNKAGITKAENVPLNLKVTQFLENDILLSNIRPYFKKIWLAEFMGGCSADVLVFRTNENYDSTYIKYCLSQDSFFAYDMAGSKGSKMPRGDKNHILNFELLDLDITNQRKIGRLFSNIDKKIAINNQINAILERVAKAIYEYYFVQFDFPDKQGKPYKSSGGAMRFDSTLNRQIPKDFEVQTIENIEKQIITGKTPKTANKEYYNGDIPFITIDDIRQNTFITKTASYLTKLGADTQKTKYLPADSICISCIATVGLVGLTTELAQTNQQINSIICQNDENLYYLYFAIKDYFKFSFGAKTGNITKNMNKGDFSNILLTYPNNDLLKEYHLIVKPLFNSIKNLTLQNQKLKNLRDFLLPLLINAQVQI